jgi:hypothetical protein
MIIWKSCVLAVTAVLAVCTAQSALAIRPLQKASAGQQSPAAVGGIAGLPFGTPQLIGGQTTIYAAPQGIQTYGTFGNQTLGLSFVPSPSTFGGGIQTSPDGSFLSIGRQIGQQAASGTPARLPALNPALLPDISGRELMGAVGDALATSGGIGPPATPATTVRRNATGVASLGPRGVQSYTRSEGLSDLLTRIARSKGIIASQAINVYLSNNVALIQGTVHTPQDRVLLANVLNLEPEVSQVDNRLAVEGAGTTAQK